MKKEKVPMETLEWLRVHFAPSDFHGRLQIGHRGRKEGVLPLFTCERGQMMDFVAHMDVSPKGDYYITGNMVCGVKRRMEDLFSLHNIVVDVDCHGDDVPHEFAREEMISKFAWSVSHHLEVPEPTSVVYTGRGLQFWWAIKPVHVKCKWYYDRVKDDFLEKMKVLAEEDDFYGITVDGTASKNAVGYYRLPGTYHSKVKKLVTAEIHPDKPVYVLQELMEEIEACEKIKEESLMNAKQALSTVEQNAEGQNQKVCAQKKEQGTRRHKVCEQGKNQETKPHEEKWNNPHVRKLPWQKTKGDLFCQGKYLETEINMLRGYHSLGFFRLKQLIQLRHFRDAPKGKEERNNFNFMVYNVVCPMLGHEKAVEKMKLFNEGFKVPMTESEMMGTISSARLKKGYAFTNESLIAFFHIDAEEQELLGLYPVEKTKNFMMDCPSKTVVRAILKEDRDEKICLLHQQKLSNQKIATTLGISHVTVGKVLKKVKEVEKQSFTKQVKELLLKKCSYTEIAKQLDCSVSKISRLLKGKEEVLTLQSSSA